MPKTIIGFDLGGTKSAIALYDADTWKELRHEKMPTGAARGLESVLVDAIALIKKVRQPDTVGLGMGIAGLIRRDDGVINRCPNIPGAEGFPVRKTLENRLGLPVAVENDSNCFTLAEARLGAGKTKRVVVGITMGTGVGGGIVIDGEILHGEHGFAGEIGHMLLIPGTPPYPTEDKRGDAEQFLAGTAMGKRCAAAKRPEDYLEGEVCSFLRPEIFREVAWLVTSLTHLLDPSIIIFGGSAGRALRPHFAEITQELSRWMLPGTPVPPLAIGEREDAGTLGAALLNV